MGGMVRGQDKLCLRAIARGEEGLSVQRVSNETFDYAYTHRTRTFPTNEQITWPRRRLAWLVQADSRHTVPARTRQPRSACSCSTDRAAASG